MPSQKKSPQPVQLQFNLIMFKFNSSAIENISDVADEKVTITWNGGRDYTYGVKDVEQFVSALSTVISEQKSVGQFVNRAIRNQDLVQI